MKNSALPFWHLIIGIIGAAVVIASIFFWLSRQEDPTGPLKTRIERQAQEIAELKNRPAEVREVVREVVKEVVVEVEKECGTPAPALAAAAPAKPALQEITLRVPKAILKIECHSMEIGRWEVPASCLEKLKKALGGKVDKERHFLAVTPVVDSKPYPGPLNELKQAGLAQFRSTAGSDALRKSVGQNVLIFHRRPVQTDDARGFNVELFAQE